MRGLLGDVIGACMVWKLPVTGKSFAQDGIQRFLHPAMYPSQLSEGPPARPQDFSRWFDVPTAQIELHDSKETLNRVLDLRQM